MINEQILIDKEELDRYEESVQSFLDNEIDAERFQSMRLQQGIYGQRQEGVNMVRIKLPGGKLNPEQAESIADILEHQSQHDVAHITTRQAIQVHYIPLGETPTAIRRLADSNLTSREACNNTVRNMSACALSGVCPSEHTDIVPFLESAVSHFLRHPLTQHLPRKFKISFSGCETDCAQGMIHDIGVVAVKKDGQFGFKILAGGGLGHKPREAITVEEFIEEKDLLASMEAIISLHNRFSDRKRRAKSRIKFLVDKFGAEGFVEKYKEELERTLTALADTPTYSGKWHEDSTPMNCNPGAPREVITQKQAGFNVLPIRLPIGDITVPQLRGIAAIMNEQGLSDLRTTQDQNFIIVGVPDNKIETIKTALGKLELGLPSIGDDVVACPGTSTCRLGITSSKILGAKLSGSNNDLRVRVSGCHNGCAQPESGDIGIYGEGKRLHGKLIPHYRMYIGGDGRGNGGLAFKSLTIPSARIETAVTRLQENFSEQRSNSESFVNWSQNKGKDYFAELLSDLSKVTEDDMTSVASDHGDEAAFKVLQLGGGECAGAAQETVAANFAEAANERNYRNAFMMQRKYTESMECATESLRLIGNSLLFLAGNKPIDDLNEISQSITSTSTDSSNIGLSLSNFIKTLKELEENFDLENYQALSANIDLWTHEAASECQNIDKQLDLSGSVPKLSAANQPDADADIDLTSFGCPLHYIKARNSLRSVNSGEVVNFLFASNDSAQEASSSLTNDGHEVIDIKPKGDATRVTIKKAS